jgi:CBS domain-containing protein
MPLSKVSVSVVLKEKPVSVFSVSEESTVEAAVGEMNRNHIGSLIIKRDAQVVGIFPERDVLPRVVATGRDSKVTLVRDVMTKDFQFITKDT